MNEHLNEVEVSGEAARQWGLEESTVKKKCGITPSRLVWKKSGRTKLVTRGSMDIEFGTIIERILAGKHNDPFYGVQMLMERGDYNKDQLLRAGVPTSVLNEVNLK